MSAKKKAKTKREVWYEIRDLSDGWWLCELPNRREAESLAREVRNVRVERVTREVVLEVKP